MPHPFYLLNALHRVAIRGKCAGWARECTIERTILLLCAVQLISRYVPVNALDFLKLALVLREGRDHLQKCHLIYRCWRETIQPVTWPKKAPKSLLNVRLFHLNNHLLSQDTGEESAKITKIHATSTTQTKCTSIARIQSTRLYGLPS